ncbi:mevalonate kinase [Rhodovulum sp. YEN HP10]|uniref:mevalonate kinase family protein n=1 Tax=Rhodovulum sp. HP10 TaxID=3387397 RepID=UPI0039DFBDC2
MKVSAPGSIMITGEHAVVYGHPAIVAAIEQRIEIEVSPLPQRWLEIVSEIAEPATVDLDRIAVEGPYRFVLAAAARFAGRLSSGARLEIRSEIDPTLGLGSSAAVTVAALGAFARLSGAPTEGLHTDALAIVRQIQGRGSGADLAASLRGGMNAYRLGADMLTGAPPETARAWIDRLPLPPALGLRYAGYKTPTAEVLARIAGAMAGREAEFAALYDRMGACAAAAIAAAQAQDWTAFGAALTRYQGQMIKLGVSDGTLSRIIADAETTPGLLAAKISGSGLGDCVLALGARPEGFTPVAVAEEGLVIDD